MALRGGIALAAGTAMAVLAAGASAAQIEVNTTAEGYAGDGKCGLREAVEAANQNEAEGGCPKGRETKRDVIVLRAKEYHLGPTTNEDVNQNGDLDVTGGGPLTVRGKSRAATAITQDAEDRIFDLPSLASDLRVERLTMLDGDVTPYGGADGLGGSVRSFGKKLRITRANLDSAVADEGGSIFSNGPLVLERSDLAFNEAVSGGTLSVIGPTKLKRTDISDSLAVSDGLSPAGGAIWTGGATTITDSSITGSSAEATNELGLHFAQGGGVYLQAGSLKIRRSLVWDNEVSAANPNATEEGGGLYVGSGTVSIVNSTFSGNLAASPEGDGGAIYNDGNLTIHQSTFEGNVASNAGGHIFDDHVAFLGSSILTGTEAFDPCAGGLSSIGFNVAQYDDPECAYGADDDTSAQIAFAQTLSANGGPTLTLPLSPLSDAVDFVPKGDCMEVTRSRDQRGFARPDVKGGVKQPCDAGAFERRAKKP